MNLDIMRKIDRWIGIPICFTLTVLHVGKKRIIPKPKTFSPRKILFIKLFGLGSVVLSFPAILEARRKFPKAKIYYLTFAQNAEVFDFMDDVVDEVLVIDNKKAIKFVTDTFRTIKYLAHEKIDVSIDLEFFSRFSGILGFLSRSKYRVGFYNPHTEGLYRGRFLTHEIFYNHYVHAAESFRSMVRALNEYQEEKPLVKDTYRISDICFPTFISSKEDKDSLRKKLHLLNPLFSSSSNIYILNNNSSDLGRELRIWGKEKFAKLADLILESNPDNLVIFLGVEGEKEKNKSIIDLIKNKNKTLNMAGETSLKERLMLIDMAHNFITVDSGLMHLASLVKTRVIALFSTETPMLFGPLNKGSKVITMGLLCQPCLTIYNGKVPACNNNRCMNELSVERVFNEID